MERNPRPDWRDRAALTIAGGAVLLAGFLLYWLVEAVRHLADPYADPLLPPWFTTAVLLLLLGGAAAWLIMSLLGAWHRWAAPHAAYADKVVRLAEAQAEIPRTVGALTLNYHNRQQIEGAAEVPQLPPATLPDVAPLAEVIEGLPQNRLAYGRLPGGEVLMLPLASGYHILGHGDTRSGKTNFLDGLLVQLHYKARGYAIRLIAGDFKRELAATWERSPLIETVETDPTAIAEMLEELVSGHDGVLARYDAFKRLGEQSGRIIRNYGDYCTATGEKPRLVFVTIDEINAVLEAADRRANLSGALKIALQTGAGSGIFICGGAQYLGAKVFGRDGSKQFVTRAHFGAWDPVAIRTMFGEKLPEEQRALLTGQAGRGLIRTVGQPTATPFQALKCSEDDILGAIRLLTNDQPTMPDLRTSDEHAEQLNSAGTAPERGRTPPADVLITPEKLAIARRMLERGTGKIEVIETVFNRKRGGSAEYKEVAQAVDQLLHEIRR